MGRKEIFKDQIEHFWPVAKKKLEKTVESAKKVLDQGEAYLKELSKKGAKQTRKMSSSLKKEKLYYDLGKIVAHTAVSNWNTDEVIKSLLKEIKQLDKEAKNNR